MSLSLLFFLSHFFLETLKIDLNYSMFSLTSLASKSNSKSIHKVIASPQLITVLLSSQRAGSDRDNRRSSIFDFLTKSIASGALIVGVGSFFSSNLQVSFADFPKQTAWTVNEDRFPYPLPNQNATKKPRFLFGGK